MKSNVKIWGKEIPLLYIVLGVIFVTGSVLRLTALTMNPMGMHQDEAYCAYNSWSIMTHGADSYGNIRPVYYIAGMSILYSYLEMPFIALFGICTWAMRLPQAILGSLSILAMYGLGKEMRGPKTGIAFAALLAINPWHIQQSRFALDCNVAVAMLLFAVYFLCRYLNGKDKSIWGAAIFFGLTLYSYALTWIMVPLFLVFVVIFFRKRIRWNRSLVGAVLLLFLFALPLLLFLAVNMGLIPEIRTAWFTIPEMPGMRTGEMAFSLSNFKRRFLWLAAMLWSQHDDIWWMSNTTVGSYYYISTPFILLGIVYCIKAFFANVCKKKELPLFFLTALWFGAGFFTGCNIDMAKFHKVNYIHIPIIILGIIGVIWLWQLLKKAKWLPVFIGAAYLTMFGYYVYTQATFGIHYDKYGYSDLSHMHYNKYEEALDRAKELTDGDIGVLNLNYVNVLLYERLDPWEFNEQVVYVGDDLAFREVSRLGRYRFDVWPGENEPEGIVMIYPYNVQELLKELGYETEYVTECYGVAYKRSADE